MKISDIENKSNDRLQSPEFCTAVRLVFKSLGIENKMSNFRKYDSIIDWTEFAHNLTHPVQIAVVEVKPTSRTICIDLPGSSKAGALAKLNTKRYRFREWW